MRFYSVKSHIGILAINNGPSVKGYVHAYYSPVTCEGSALCMHAGLADHIRGYSEIKEVRLKY